MARRALGVLVLATVLLVAACSGSGESNSAAPTETSTADPDRIVLEWKREGGIAGFCDGMTVTAGHRASLGTCSDPGAEVTGQLLPIDWIGQLEGWRDRVAAFDRTWEDPPGQSDRMTIVVRFDGRGSVAATEVEQREIAEFAGGLFNALRLIQPRVGAR